MFPEVSSLVGFDSYGAGLLLVLTCVILHSKLRPHWPDQEEPGELLSAAHHSVLFMFPFFLCLCGNKKKVYSDTHSGTLTHTHTNEACSS